MAAKEDGQRRVADLPDSVQLRILSFLTIRSQEAAPVENQALAQNLSETHESFQPETGQTRGHNHSPLRVLEEASTGFGGKAGKASQESPLFLAVEGLAKKGFAVVDNFLGENVLSAVRTEAESFPSLREAGMGGSLGGNLWNDGRFRGDRMAWLNLDVEASNGRPALAHVIRTFKSLELLLAEQGFNVGGKVTFQLACYPAKGARYIRHTDRSPSCPLRSVTAIYYANPCWEEAWGGQLRLYTKASKSKSVETSYIVGAGDKIGVGEQRHTKRGNDEPPENTAFREGLREGNGDVDDVRGGSGVSRGPVEGEKECSGEEWLDLFPIGDRLVIFCSDMFHEVLPSYGQRFAITAWFSAPEMRMVCENGKMKCGHSKAKGSCEPKSNSPEASVFESVYVPTNNQCAQEDGIFTKNDCQHEGNMETTISSEKGSGTEHKEASEEIFVSVACYRDSECRWTIRHMLEMAESPQRVKVGVVWQVDPEEDAHMMNLDCLGDDKKRQVRQMVMDWREAKGPCLARHLAQKLWQGENYFLQVDSHMRFAQNWDSRLIAMLRAAEKVSKKPVISTYPPGYTGLGQMAEFSVDTHPVILCASGFGAEGLLRIRGKLLKEPLVGPLPSLFWAAGYSFSKASLLQEVPYSPNLEHLFFGEEMAMAVRMYTHGWDFFCPTETVVFHLWSRSHRLTRASLDDQSRAAKSASQQQVKRLLCSRKNGDGEVCKACGGNREEMEEFVFDHITSELYGIGTSRSVSGFVEYCGVDFCSFHISERALLGGLDQGMLLDG